MTSEALADLLTDRITDPRGHFDVRLSATPAHIHGNLLPMESDMLDLRAETSRLREAIRAQARRLEERRCARCRTPESSAPERSKSGAPIQRLATP